ncbi:MAG: NAD(P)/FAD-dependent oxidoreductase [Veillonellaceae bacterium]|nr:NAD(P)/FAD-dependent oxidoreductase [Veillonellaceae bacterium]
MKDKHIIIVGAGAAGLLAAATASRLGAKVTVLEKMNLPGLKMGITGKGRCNITNAADSMDDFIKNTPGNGKFLYSAYQQFTNKDLFALLDEWGLAYKVERGGRVFPQSDSALEVRNMFRRVLEENGAILHTKEAVTRILVENGHACGVRTDRATYQADAVVLATGGCSYPATGSSGDGLRMVKDLGLTITDIRPSLVPMVTKETWVKDLMGLSLRNVSVTAWRKGKKKTSLFGEMMFTHFGLTGPLILSLSHTIGKWLLKDKTDVWLTINLKPALSPDVLDKRLQRDFQKYHKKQLVNGLVDLLPKRLIPIILVEADFTGHEAVASLTKEGRQRLVEIIQELPVTVTALRPVEEAIVTAGGISVKEIDPKTMEVKKIPGLYACGEVLDIDAFTGGYNLQAAFSTGYVAATHAVESLQDK